MAEKDIQFRILRYLGAHNSPWCVKVISANKRGCPDILACIDGRFVAIEVKTEKGVLSEIQKVQGERIVNAGGIFIVARSVADVAAALNATLCTAKGSSPVFWKQRYTHPD